MSCGNCGSGKKIIVDRTVNPTLRSGKNNTIQKPQLVVTRKLRPYNNIDKRA